MKKLFEIGIGLDEETKTYIATVGSVTDNFPMPEPRRILTLSDNRPSIVLAKINGRS